MYCDFQKIILDFQLQEHERFLSKFTELFKEVDSDTNGIIHEGEFKELMQKMNIVSSEEEIDYLLTAVDPFNNQRMTYSEVVHLLSSQMVPKDDVNPQVTIPILEKFVNIVDGIGIVDESADQYGHSNFENPPEMDDIPPYTGNEGEP